MKKLSFLLLLFILLISGCSKKNTFTLKGNISGLTSDTILVFYEVPDYKLDTILAQKGNFNYTITPDTFTVFSLLLNDRTTLPVYADKGENVTLEGSIGNIQIKGKGENEHMAHILRTIKNSEADKQSLMATVDSFITQNPNSFTNLYLIDKYYVQDSLPDYERTKKLVEGLSGIIKDTPYITELQGKLIEKEKQKNSRSVTPISCPDKNGKAVGRNEMKDKYVLLDFWASWNEESKAAQDSLVAVQKALKKEKFLIISFSLDVDKEAWLKACDKDTMQWKQVCDFKGWENAFVKQQGITSLPTNILIAPDKKIIARDIRGKELIDKVKQLIEQDKEKEKAAKAAERARKKK
ncbi:thioredoxin-like domain-containing protein [Phocaeicola sp.]